jgi:hypothetical protein
MSVAIPTIDEIAATVREVVRAELAAARAATATHDPLDTLEPKALAAERGCTDSAITKALKAGSIRGKKIGGRWSICRGDVCPCRDCVAWTKAGAR